MALYYRTVSYPCLRSGLRCGGLQATAGETIDDLFDILVEQIYYLCSKYYLCIYDSACGKMRVNLRWQGGPSTQFFGQPLRPFGEKLKHVALLGFVWPDPASLNYEAR